MAAVAVAAMLAVVSAAADVVAAAGVVVVVAALVVVGILVLVVGLPFLGLEFLGILSSSLSQSFFSLFLVSVVRLPLSSQICGGPQVQVLTIFLASCVCILLSILPFPSYLYLS